MVQVHNIVIFLVEHAVLVVRLVQQKMIFVIQRNNVLEFIAGTVQAVFDVEAETDEEAMDKLPPVVDLGDVYILDMEELEGEEE